MAALAEDAPLRPTGNMERFNIIRNHINFYNNIQVSATYTLPLGFITTHTLLPIIQSALAETLKSHPILGVTIQDEETLKPRWERLFSINVSKILTIIEHDGSASHDSWITEGHRTRLDQVDILPPWRIIIAIPPASPSPSSTSSTSTAADTFTLAFYAHHAICDGLSAGAFHITFLSSLNTLITNTSLILSSQPDIPVPKVPLIETLEQRTSFPVSPFFVLKALFQAWIYNPSSPLLWTGPPITSIPPTSPPISNLITFSLDNEKVEKLLQRCRTQNTTLTALISVLIARYLAVTKGPIYKRFVGAIPFSLRKWTGHKSMDMGCYVSGLSPLFSSEEKTPRGYISCASSFKDGKTMEKEEKERDEQILWNSARQCKQFIQEGTKSQRNQVVALLGFVDDWRVYFLSRLGTKRETSFEVTNLGVLDGGLSPPSPGSKTKTDNKNDNETNNDNANANSKETNNKNEDKEKGAEIIEKEKATFSEMIFSSALCTYADPFCVSIVSVKGGNLTVGINWIEDVTGGDNARGLRVWLERGLEGIVSGEVERNGEVVGKEGKREGEGKEEGEEEESVGSGSGRRRRKWMAGAVVAVVWIWVWRLI